MITTVQRSRRRHGPLRGALSVIVAAGIAATACACSAVHNTTGAGAAALPPASPPSAMSTSDAGVSATPAVPVPVPVLMRGDAATNPACKLAAVEEVERVAGGLRAVDELGLRTPGPDVSPSYNCTWHFAPTDLNTPAIVVIYNTTRTVQTALIAYDKSLVTDKFGTAVPHLGDVAVLRGSILDLVDKTVQMKISAFLHSRPTGAVAVAMAKLILPRVKR